MRVVKPLRLPDGWGYDHLKLFAPDGAIPSTMLGIRFFFVKTRRSSLSVRLDCAGNLSRAAACARPREAQLTGK